MKHPPRSNRNPRLLVISPYSVEPMIHGGAVRIGNLMRRLASDLNVWLMVFIGGTDDPEQRVRLAEAGVTPLFQQTPESAGHADRDGFYSPSVARRIRALVQAHSIDVVQLEYAELARYALDDLGAPVILVEHDLAYRARDRARVAGADTVPGSAVPRAIELQACASANAVILMSEDDRTELRRHLPSGDHLQVVPNGVDLDHFRPHGGDRRDVLFVGSFPHRPNRDAAHWMADEIWPRVLRAVPAARLTLAGARPTDDILALDGRDGIRVAGDLPDLAPLYRSHAVLSAPIRFGSGTRLKILEALASGIPVVSTTIGAEGLGLEPGAHLMVADDAESFAERVIRLLSEADLRHRLAESGRTAVASGFGWDAIAARALAVVHGVADPPRRPPPPAIPARDVTVVVHTLDGPGGWPDGLDEQRATCSWNAVWAGPPPHPAPAIASLGVPIGGGGLGTRLNAWAASVPARVVVFLAAGSRIPDPDWLSRLVAPLGADRPPAAVQGGVTLEDASGQVSDPDFGSIRRLCATIDGAPVPDPSCLAVDRGIWSEFPFASTEEPAEYLWLQDLRSVGRFVLPILDARVHRRVTSSLLEWFIAGRHQGRRWAPPGTGFGVGQALSDARTVLTDSQRTSRRLRVGQAIATIGRWVGGAARRREKAHDVH
jgi:glycosyltransferase involved in cell wall biosynthesis